LRTLLSTSIALLVAAAPALAAASPIFPAEVKQHLSLSYDLGTTHCTICHQNNSGGVGTATQPFGAAIKKAGAVLENTSSLDTALDTVKMEMIDSDCDQTPDIQQLQEGRDPNTGAYIDGSGKPTPAEKGCGATPPVDAPAYG